MSCSDMKSLFGWKPSETALIAPVDVA
ncbi:MAG: hypothetical protein QOF90_3648, partial [Acetobacteraceae bacterium]|nr:hypothetical protein [Acetobacteraceae bacterium]